MTKRFINKVRSLIRKSGFDLIRYSRDSSGVTIYPNDFSSLSKEICETVKPYTMTCAERINALVNSVEYIVQNDIEGAFVECGVWKGGSAMAIALTLIRLEQINREIYLYDTFAGMTEPKEVDVSVDGDIANSTYTKAKLSEDVSGWCLSTLDEVQSNLASTGYPAQQIHYVKGKVEDTVPGVLPASIALLRLDTDWYESTRHEMHHMFPRLQKHGVLIIDDYGYWKGSKKAVDEYIKENKIRILLNRIDFAGGARIAVKT